MKAGPAGLHFAFMLVGCADLVLEAATLKIEIESFVGDGRKRLGCLRSLGLRASLCGRSSGIHRYVSARCQKALSVKGRLGSVPTGTEPPG